MADKEKDLGTQGTEDTAKGKLNEAAGTVQKKTGKALGNEEMEAKGKVRRASGKAQAKAGKVERKADDALNS